MKRLLLLVACLAVFAMSAGTALADTNAERIAKIQKQIAELMAKLQELQNGGSSTSCYVFSENMGFGDKGKKVANLQSRLIAMGYSISSSDTAATDDSGDKNSRFGESTAAAVVKFQQANNISPLSGYVGPLTRAQLNKNCTGTKPVIDEPIPYIPPANTSSINRNNPNYGTIRFTAPEDGEYEIDAKVSQATDVGKSYDSEFYVLVNGEEEHGKSIKPFGKDSFKEDFDLEKGDTVDFLVGKGADGKQYGSGLKIWVTIKNDDSDKEYSLENDIDSDPSATHRAWSFGNLATKTSNFVRASQYALSPDDNGLNVDTWGMAGNEYPVFYKNNTGRTAYAGNGSSVLPDGVVWFFPGLDPDMGYVAPATKPGKCPEGYICNGQTSLQIISPIGGTYEVGDDIEVRWTGSKGTKRVGILLRESDISPSFPFDSGAMALATANDGHTEFEIGNIQPGLYTIRILCGEKGECGYVDSPSYITVTGGDEQSWEPYIKIVRGKASGDFEINSTGAFGIEGKYLAGDEDSTNVYIDDRAATLSQIGDNLLYATAPSNLKLGKTYDLYVVTNKGKSNVVKVKVLYGGSVEKSVTVLSPNGGETLVAGASAGIKFSTKGVEGKKLNVFLFNADKGENYFVGPVMIEEDGNDSESFTIPSWIAPGNHYKINIETVDSNNMLVKDMSDAYVTIASKTSAEASTKVNTPNGNEKYKVGDSLPYSVSVSKLSSKGELSVYISTKKGDDWKSGRNYFIVSGGGYSPNSDKIVNESGASEITNDIQPGDYYLVAEWKGYNGATSRDSSDDTFEIEARDN